METPDAPQHDDGLEPWMTDGPIEVDTGSPQDVGDPEADVTHEDGTHEDGGDEEGRHDAERADDR